MAGGEIVSGPYCASCDWFRAGMLSSEWGECFDPTKIIYFPSGKNVNEPPAVKKNFSCSVHKQSLPPNNGR